MYAVYGVRGGGGEGDREVYGPTVPTPGSATD